jgi:Zn-dependent protease
VNLPGLQFKLFGFQVTIGLDFLLLVLIFSSAQSLSAGEIVAWILILAVSILAHELGHAFALRRYGINPVIRLWMMGGMTMSGFPLTPKRALVVSAAGPAVGISIGLIFLVIYKSLFPFGFDRGDLAGFVVGNMFFVNLVWGAINLLPIAALDGGNIVTSAFLWALGERGRTPAMLIVALASVVIAIIALAIGQWYLGVVVIIFSFLNPAPYLEMWRILTGGPRQGAAPGAAPQRRPQEPRRDTAPRPAVAVAMSARRQYGETYATTLGSMAGDVDLDDIEHAPAPLLSDVTAMVSRRDDAGLAARLIGENDPVAAFGIVARLVDGKRVDGVLGQLKRSSAPGRDAAVLKMQVSLHALGRFQESIAAAGALGSAGNAASAVLVARCGARIGDRKLTQQALERAVQLRAASGVAGGGSIDSLSDSALGDIARVGPDQKVAQLLSQLRGTTAN